MSLVLTLTSIVISVLTFVYAFYKYKFLYWKKKGVPHLEPLKIPFGNVSFKEPVIELLEKVYKNSKKNKQPIQGLYLFFNPTAVATDLDVIKNILIKDFNNFADRGVYYNEKDDPLSGHLFALDGEKWKKLRTKLSPTFTSGKMKFMFPTIVSVANEFHKILNEIVQKENEIEIKDLLARFTTDIIGTCAFGIECNSLKDPDAEFRRYGRKIFENPQSRIERILKQEYREFSRFLGLRNVQRPVEKFFLNAVKDTVIFREKNNIRRNDFMDILIELKNGNSADLGNMTIEEIAAQVFVFFLAGFETSSTTMSFCLYELALRQDIQEKLRIVINEVLKKHGDNFTYEGMVDMKYLDQVVNETLRKYPPLPVLQRVSTRQYKIPDHDIILDSNKKVMIPIYSIHHDPDIYPNPENFDPERFSHEMVHKRHPLSFLSFGDGPRNCIGLRFGRMQTKIGLVMLLQNFKFSKAQKTQVPLEFDRKLPLLTAKGGLWLRLEKI